MPDGGEQGWIRVLVQKVRWRCNPLPCPGGCLVVSAAEKITVASDPSAVPHPISPGHGHGEHIDCCVFDKRAARAFDDHICNGNAACDALPLTAKSCLTSSHVWALAHHRMRVTVLPALMLAVAPSVTAFAPAAGFTLAKMGSPAVQPRASASMSARRPARLMDLKATAAYPLQETITGGPREEADYTVPEWRKKVDLAAWANEVREVEKKYRAQQTVEEDVAHMKKMLSWTYVLYAVGKHSFLANIVLSRGDDWRQEGHAAD